MNNWLSKIQRFDSLDSTNLEAARQAVAGASEGLGILADEQTAGRGRLQRQWISPKGAGLYFSILLKPRIVQRTWPLITLMAAIAVHDALLKACALQTDIKWPNDILVNGRKLCGILAETIDTDRAVILGIGINLTNAAFPPELRDTATSVDAASGKSVSVEGLLQALITSLEWHYQILQSPNGVEETIQKWSERSSYAEGKKIVVSNGNEIVEGTTCGLESDGALRLETADGEIKIVRAGDVNAVRSTK